MCIMGTFYFIMKTTKLIGGRERKAKYGVALDSVTSCQSTMINFAGQRCGCLTALPSVGPDSYLTVNLVGNT